MVSAAELLARLAEQSATLATAESLTGGQLAALITAIPGASAVYRGGVISYATDLKVSLLGVSDHLVHTDGVVSAACAQAMALGVRDLCGATWAVSTTGVAGPDRQEDKPVGTVFVGIAGPSGVSALELALTGSRSQIQAQTCDEAVAGLLDRMGREEPPLR